MKNRKIQIDVEKVPEIQIEKLPRSKLKNWSLRVGMIGVGISSFILIFVVLTYKAQRKFQEASVYPSIILNLERQDTLMTFESIFDVDTINWVGSYYYTLENKSPYTIIKVRTQSLIDELETNPLKFEGVSDTNNMNVFAPEEKSLIVIGRYDHGNPPWKRQGRAYLHFRVDFSDPNQRQFVYKKTFFLHFKNWEPKEDYAKYSIFEMSMPRSSLYPLTEEVK